MAKKLELRGLTLHQPWNWAVINAGKPVENRVQRPPTWLIGQWFALHAGLTYDATGAEFIRRAFGLQVPEQRDIPSGAITAVAKLGGAYQLINGKVIGERQPKNVTPWAVGPWCWEIADLVVMPEPIPIRGMQGLWRVPRKELELVRAGWRVVRPKAEGKAV
jgi:hypothetical protein